MKRKLVAGLGVITLIFAISGILIFADLQSVVFNEGIKDRQDEVLDSYADVMLYLRKSQAELYRYKAGYSRDVVGLERNVLRMKDALSSIRKSYEGLNIAACNKCHILGKKISALRMSLDETSLHLAHYKEKTGLMAMTEDPNLARSLENDAAEEGNRLMGAVLQAAGAAERMNDHLDRLQMSALRRAGIFIIAAIIVSTLLALAVIVSMIRSIRRPLNMLVEGIERVSSGRYDSKVEVVSDDEIGFLARTFNAMTGSLAESTRQRDLLEEELRQLNAGLEKRVKQATDELKATHEQMLRTETLSAVGTLASGVAHELATPLSSVINYVQMIRRRTGDDDSLAGEMSIIEKELVRCRDILRGMLTFVRPPEKEKVQTDVNAALRDLIELTRYRARSRKIEIKESLEPSLPSVVAVPGQLRQVFMNIMVNALDSMTQGGKIEVSTSLEGDNVAVRISDTGPGISRDDMNRIFDPFFTSKKSGTGLGLAISYGIIKGHGGDIAVESEEGKGTVFVVSLPALNSRLMAT